MINPNTITLRKSRLVILFTIVFLLIVFINAWLSDDSYITFRTVENFINGYGLTWNISERVQAFTHPLWMFIISGFYFFTGEVYYTSLIVSMLISTCAVFLLLYKLSGSIFNSMLAGLILIFSKAFIDYSTSGLENSLTHLLVVLFFIIYFCYRNENKKLFLLTLIASSVLLTRMDTIIILLPALIIIYLKANKLRGFITIFTALIPFIIWEIFSLFYYGYPFPNTAYAKLNTGINQIELIQQGLHYLLFSVYMDPLTPVIIIAGLLLPFITKNKGLVPLSIGIALYLVYLINIGGDFMGGRFLTVPFICSAIIISKIELTKHSVENKQNKNLLRQLSIILAVVIMGLLSPKPTVLSTANYGLGPKIVKAFRFGPYIVNMYHGIVDERIWYYNNTGLLNNLFEKKINDHLWVKDALKIKESKQRVIVKEVIGLIGYYAGSNVHIIDPMALSDPLLSKLPSTGFWRYNWRIKVYRGDDMKKWRIGHFVRKIPDGYIETIETGENKIKNPSLHKYYDKLSLVIKGNLFDLKRIVEIWNLNTGEYDYLINEYNKRLPTNSDILRGAEYIYN